MRVLVVGASGALDRRLVPQLLEPGHTVVDSAGSSESESSCDGARRDRTSGIDGSPDEGGAA